MLGLVDWATRLLLAVERLAQAADDIAELYYRDAGLQRSAGPAAADPLDAKQAVVYASDAASWEAEQAAARGLAPDVDDQDNAPRAVR